jgi:hypothetical protein
MAERPPIGNGPWDEHMKNSLQSIIGGDSKHVLQQLSITSAGCNRILEAMQKSAKKNSKQIQMDTQKTAKETFDALKAGAADASDDLKDMFGNAFGEIREEIEDTEDSMKSFERTTKRATKESADSKTFKQVFGDIKKTILETLHLKQQNPYDFTTNRTEDAHKGIRENLGDMAGKLGEAAGAGTLFTEVLEGIGAALPELAAAAAGFLAISKIVEMFTKALIGNQERVAEMTKFFGDAGKEGSNFNNMLTDVSRDSIRSIEEVHDLGFAYHELGGNISNSNENLKKSLTAGSRLQFMFGTSTEVVAKYMRAWEQAGDKPATNVDKLTVAFRANNLGLDSMNEALSMGYSMWSEYGNVSGITLDNMTLDMINVTGLFKKMNIDVKEAGEQIHKLYGDTISHDMRTIRLIASSQHMTPKEVEGIKYTDAAKYMELMQKTSLDQYQKMTGGTGLETVEELKKSNPNDWQQMMTKRKRATDYLGKIAPEESMDLFKGITNQLMNTPGHDIGKFFAPPVGGEKSNMAKMIEEQASKSPAVAMAKFQIQAVKFFTDFSLTFLPMLDSLMSLIESIPGYGGPHHKTLAQLTGEETGAGEEATKKLPKAAEKKSKDLLSTMDFAPLAEVAAGVIAPAMGPLAIAGLIPELIAASKKTPNQTAKPTIGTPSMLPLSQIIPNQVISSGPLGIAPAMSMMQSLSKSANTKGLDYLSAPYEGGVGTVSSGRNDKGGVSYGIGQMASRMGTPAKFLNFLKTHNPQYYAQLAPFMGDMGLQHGQFAQHWRALAKADPTGFRAAQASYLQPNYLNKNVLGSLGHWSNNPIAQQLAYSTAIQFGTANQWRGRGGTGAAGIFHHIDADKIKSVQELIMATEHAKGEIWHPGARAGARYDREGKAALAEVTGKLDTLIAATQGVKHNQEKHHQSIRRTLASNNVNSESFHKSLAHQNI